jgi:hypothetical protein
MTAPHDRPTTAELLESVREWMERDVMPNVSPSVQFHTRVAMNVLSIVEREIQVGKDQLDRYQLVMQSLGFESDAQLAASIREGHHDEGLLQLLEALRPVIEDKVRVANPRYLR